MKNEFKYFFLILIMCMANYGNTQIFPFIENCEGIVEVQSYEPIPKITTCHTPILCHTADELRKYIPNDYTSGDF